MPPPTPQPPPPYNRHITTITPSPTIKSHDSSSLPCPYKVGNLYAIKINEENFQKYLKSCNFCLLGRLSTFKGKISPKPYVLFYSLSPLLKTHGDWKLSSLGKGFYSLLFSSLEDKAHALSLSSLKLPFGVFQLYHWVQDFNPATPLPISHVWIQIHGLAIEYWHPNILLSIANVVGPPITLSKSTIDYSLGFFAKVLEVNLSHKLPSTSLVERENFSFYVQIVYENIPPYCSCCGGIGHGYLLCNKRKVTMETKNSKKQSTVSPLTKMGNRASVDTASVRLDVGFKKNAQEESVGSSVDIFIAPNNSGDDSGSSIPSVGSVLLPGCFSLSVGFDSQYQKSRCSCDRNPATILLFLVARKLVRGERNVPVGSDPQFCISSVDVAKMVHFEPNKFPKMVHFEPNKFPQLGSNLSSFGLSFV